MELEAVQALWATEVELVTRFLKTALSRQTRCTDTFRRSLPAHVTKIWQPLLLRGRLEPTYQWRCSVGALLRLCHPPGDGAEREILGYQRPTDLHHAQPPGDGNDNCLLELVHLCLMEA